MTLAHALKLPDSVTRRRFLNASLLGVCALLSVRPSQGRDSDYIRTAIDDGLDKLAARQNNDGSFGSDTELFGRDPAVAALSGLAFLASGSLPGRGRYGNAISKIVTFLCNCSLQIDDRQTGFLNIGKSYEQTIFKYVDDNDLDIKQIDGLISNMCEKGKKPLYGHGYATLFLAEVLGMTADQSIQDRIKRSVDLIVRAQNAEGGWRYAPSPVPLADIPVTVCQLSALRACQNVGVYVPLDTIARAVAFIQNLQNSDGGFRYMTVDGPSGYGRTAAAIHALQSSGSDCEVIIQRGFEYLEKTYSSDAQTDSKKDRMEYGTYAKFYAVLAYWRAAKSSLERSKRNAFIQRIRQDLITSRSKDGMWKSNISPEVETAFALCALLTFQEKTPFFSL